MSVPCTTQSSLKLMRKWEELGQQLEKTAIAFLGTCTALDFPNTTGSPGVRELVWKLDDMIISINDRVQPLINRARSSLARTRNELAAPIFRLPDETLSSIFHIAMHTVEIQTPGQLSARNLVNTRYRHLHALIPVCSTWRRVILAQRSFWSLIPIVRQNNGRFMSTATLLSLERSAGRNLHLVAELCINRGDMSTFILGVLSHYGSHFRVINLKSNWEGLLRNAVYTLVGSTEDPLRSLADLSLCYYYDQMGLFPTSCHLYTPNDPPAQHATFNRLLESVRILKLRSVIFEFAGVSFKSLVELRLQAIQFENMAKFEELLWALSSSSQLHVLEIISIVTPGNAVESTSTHDFPISLPALKQLYLEDLFQDILNLVLASIEPGSHRVTLNLTSKCLRIFQPGGVEIVGFHGLAIQDVRVDTLKLTCRFNDINTDGGGIRALLERLPTITSLFIDACYLSPDYMSQLMRPTAPTSKFPKLTELYISRSTTPTSVIALLQDVVNSHPMEVLGLGIAVTWLVSGRSQCLSLETPHPILDPLRVRLLNAVPRVVWLPGNFSNVTFESDFWQL